MDSHERRLQKAADKLERMSDERSDEFGAALEELASFEYDEVEEGDHERAFVKTAHADLTAILAQAGIDQARREAERKRR